MEQVMDQQAGMELTDDNVEQVGFAAAGWPLWTGRPMSCAALTERQRSSCGRDPHSSPTHLAAVCASCMAVCSCPRVCAELAPQRTLCQGRKLGDTLTRLPNSGCSGLSSSLPNWLFTERPTPRCSFDD